MSISSEPSNRITLILEPISKRVSIAPKTNVFTALLNLQYPINAICGGKGHCGKCKIRVNLQESNFTPLTDVERKLLTPQEIKDGFRLACQTFVLKDSRIFLSETLLGKQMQILTRNQIENFTLRPKFWKVVLDIGERPPNTEPISDFHRLKEAIYKAVPILSVYRREILTSYECLKKLPESLRSKQGTVTVTLESIVGIEKEPIRLLNVEAGNHLQELFGIAVDLGTTTIVGYLIDMRHGEVAAIESMLNPQVAIGEDVITRMTYIQQHTDGMDYAQKLVKDAIDQLIDQLAQKANIKSQNIVEMSIVGNTAMHHIFFGLSTNYLGLAPYPPVLQESLAIHNYEFNLKQLVPNSEIYSPPAIAGFVGGDAVADIIATQIDQEEKNSLLIDIGTNGELVLGNKSGGLLTASVAAGSALEGAHISNGMRGTVGAIERVTINPTDWCPTINVIGNIEPIGICGSGIIDIIAEMLRVGLLTRSGKFNMNHPQFNSHPRIRKGTNGYEYILHSSQFPAIYNYELANSHYSQKKPAEIIITQDDVRQVQKAKGAFLAGTRMLLLEQKSEVADIEQLFLAGAFGNYIRKENALFIGLIPDIELTKVQQVGNAAGTGAQMLLLNTNLRIHAEQMVKTIKYIEIAQREAFQGEFARSMMFPHKDLKLFPSIAKEYEKIPER